MRRKQRTWLRKAEQVRMYDKMHFTARSHHVQKCNFTIIRCIVTESRKNRKSGKSRKSGKGRRSRTSPHEQQCAEVLKTEKKQVRTNNNARSLRIAKQGHMNNNAQRKSLTVITQEPLGGFR